MQRHWAHGETYIDEEKGVYDAHGLLGYLTIFNQGSIDKSLKELTLFPKGARIIASSLKTESKKREVLVSKDVVRAMYNFYENKENHYVREDGHAYFDGKDLRYCGDKVYIEMDEDFIIDNFGEK